MTDQPLFHILPGPFNFLRPETDDVLGLMPATVKDLPSPHSVFLSGESSTFLQCMPVLVGEEVRTLRESLLRYLQAEELVQIMILKRQSFDSRRYNAVWHHYRGLLQQVSKNVVTSNYGRDYPQVFWLWHSIDVARALRDCPKRILRRDLNVGREHGDEIKYTVLNKYLDRVFTLLYDVVSQLTHERDDFEEQLFPPLVTQMRDNVLIFTEEHIGHDLNELLSYFRGYLKLDGRAFRDGLIALRKWHRRLYAGDSDLRSVVGDLLDLPPSTTADDALLHPGYLTFLSKRRDYNDRRFLSRSEVEVCERLLIKLKEFELIHNYRRLIVHTERRGQHLICDAREAGRAGEGQRELILDSATRVLDFMSPWVVDPEVSRGGLIYDITNFSATVSRLRLSDRQAQDHSFVSIFRFQRRFDQLAHDLRLRWEKYLGDGAFYSGRDPRRLLIAAIHMQRFYVQAVDEGFPFDAGMRIALNYGEYRLLPFGGGTEGEECRYEVFGHGVVELSRLVSGKTTQEIEEIRTFLVTKGYDEQRVNNFFAPLLEGNLDLVDKQEEQRRFYAYLNRNGALINEGIVATTRFLEELDRSCGFEAFLRFRDADRGYVAVNLSREGSPFLVGLRKLGLANLKGLDRVAVYEVVDGAGWSVESAEALNADRLINAVDEGFTSLIARR